MVAQIQRYKKGYTFLNNLNKFINYLRAAIKAAFSLILLTSVLFEAFPDFKPCLVASYIPGYVIRYENNPYTIR